MRSEIGVCGFGVARRGAVVAGVTALVMGAAAFGAQASSASTHRLPLEVSAPTVASLLTRPTCELASVRSSAAGVITLLVKKCGPGSLSVKATPAYAREFTRRLGTAASLTVVLAPDGAGRALLRKKSHPQVRILLALTVTSGPQPGFTVTHTSKVRIGVNGSRRAEEKAAAEQQRKEEARARQEAQAANKKAEEEAAARRKAEEEAAANKKAEEEAAAKKRPRKKPLRRRRPKNRPLRARKPKK